MNTQSLTWIYRSFCSLISLVVTFQIVSCTHTTIRICNSTSNCVNIHISCPLANAVSHSVIPCMLQPIRIVSKSALIVDILWHTQLLDTNIVQHKRSHATQHVLSYSCTGFNFLNCSSESSCLPTHERDMVIIYIEALSLANYINANHSMSYRSSIRKCCIAVWKAFLIDHIEYFYEILNY